MMQPIVTRGVGRKGFKAGGHSPRAARCARRLASSVEMSDVLASSQSIAPTPTRMSPAKTSSPRPILNPRAIDLDYRRAA